MIITSAGWAFYMLKISTLPALSYNNIMNLMSGPAAQHPSPWQWVSAASLFIASHGDEFHVHKIASSALLLSTCVAVTCVGN